MKFYITTAIDYINGKPHVGHAYEKVAADVIARWHRLKGEDVLFLTGTDEHGAKVHEAAEKSGQSDRAYADGAAEHFRSAWESLGLSYDRFIRTTDEDHEQAVKKVVQLMKDRGFLYEGEYTGLYCVGHEAFITEKDLVDGLCPDHKTKPELVTEKNWFLKVSAFTEELRETIHANEFIIWPEERRNEVLSMLKDFGDVAISRPNVKWAIELPWDPEQTVYVWIDALINYLSGAGYIEEPEKFKKYWPADWHFVGKDIIKFHCIIWPAMLLAAGIDLPKGVCVHGYLTIDGQKISKSIGNVISPIEWVEKYGSDAVRYLLMREVPFGQDGDVSEAKLRARYEGDLQNGLGNLVSRVTNMIEKFEDGVLPEVPGHTVPPFELGEIEDLMTGFKFHDALAKIWEAIAWANQRVDETKPWDLAKRAVAGDAEAKTQLSEVLSDLTAEVYLISKALAPFMPEAADRVRKVFEGGHDGKVIKINDLFPRLEELAKAEPSQV